ncbi:MAG: UvrD-helicase domain-containing protein [Clostridia bacterium]|nr:UvrD-helicase domain-containing protein [Clostridia bacterium]
MDFSRFNEKQKEAILQTDGQVLVLAGAGSGKTTMLVSRLVYILETKNVRPSNILAITFTNKAAAEMRERIEAQIGDLAKGMWISTFHSACVRLLRSCIDRIGFDPSFVIYDSSDSKTVIKDCMKELNIDERLMPLKMLQGEISRAKDNLQDYVAYGLINSTDHRKKVIADVYELYQKKLQKNNALDFDDIVFSAVRVLSENPDILEQQRERFKYIMVDEYQDTNNAQYMLISLLAGSDGNICVVGDDDQCLYRFRGANIRNILDFEKEYPNAHVIKLEQNYRSTSNILNAANAVIANNKGRKGKNLWTAKDGGDPIMSYLALNERDEARFIANQISKKVHSGGKFSDCAILYRTNAQSRVIEEMLLQCAVPYRVLAGLRFYDRKEIKDIIAYLRIIHNPSDAVSLKRVINEPKRGIGASSLEKAEAIADEKGQTLFETVLFANEYTELSRAAAKMVEFGSMIKAFQKAAEVMHVSDLVARVLNESGYMAMLELENSVESRTRIENLNEFVSAVTEYEKSAESPSLGGFLENVALVSDIDAYDEDQDACVLMTVHSAKGLEFPVVFLAGLEDGLFPSSRSTAEEDIEEERRLCYVAITRAKETLYITQARSRTVFGKTGPCFPSRFYKEIPPEYLKDAAPPVQKTVVKATQSLGRSAPYAETYKKPVAQATAAVKSDYFTTGDRVLHQKFGEGTIAAVTPFERDALLEINFDSVGTKRLMAAYAKLKKL